jgi:hypothetical protein
MALTQSIKPLYAVVPSAQPTPRSNVIPLPSPRVLLPVTLRHVSEALIRAQLATLLHSPLGVYVVRTQVIRGEIRVLLDIAPEDLDFTMHTLIATLVDATIGRVTRRPRSAAAVK